MSNLLDIFNSDAFGEVALTNAVSNVDHVPGQIGALTFAGNASGVPTTRVAIEYRDQGLSVIPTSPRGGPAPQEVRDKSKIFPLDIPNIKIEETIGSASVQDVRQFGTADLASVQSIVNDAMLKLTRRLDLTLEFHRLGAIRGIIHDADGSVLTDLFSAFSTTAPDDTVFSASSGTLRKAITETQRRIFRAAKLLLPPSAQLVAACGDEFWDAFINHADVVTTYQNWSGAAQALGGDFNNSVFPFAGCNFFWYRGEDSATENDSSGTLTGKVGIASDSCQFFLTGVPDLYSEHYAPADFLDTVNEVGLPRYLRMAVDPVLGRWAKLHLQSSPLPICNRPQTLVRGHF